MSLDRALYVDMLSPSQQGAVGAWAARMSGVADVLGFLVSHIDLPATAPFSWFSIRQAKAGSNEGQLKCLCFIVSFSLLATHSVTAWAAQERRLLSSGGESLLDGLSSTIHGFIRVGRTIPDPFKWVFAVQGFTWIGWYPLMFYSTLWVGAIWAAGHAGADPVSATRYGAGALFYRSILSLALAFLAPRYIGGEMGKLQMAPVWCLSLFLSAALLFATLLAEWTTSAGIASLLLVLTGLPWAIINWVPFSLVGILIANDRHAQPGDDEDEREQRNGRGGERDAFLETPGRREPHAGSLHHKAGAILALLNTAIVLPQFLSTALSSLIFALFDRGDPEDGALGAADASSIGILFRLGAFSAIVAALLARQLSIRHSKELQAR